MIDTIGPMVRGDTKKASSIRLAHILGGTLGGALTGFALGAVGSFVRTGPLLWLTFGVAAVALAWDLAREGKKLGTSRQTPRSWRYLLPPPLVAFLNGFDLGLGWSTRIYFVSYLAAMSAAFATGHALWGALIGASFGGSRAATVAIAEATRGSGGELVPARGSAAAINAVAIAQFIALTLALALLG